MLIVLMLVKAQNMSEDKQHVQQEEEKKSVEGNIKWSKHRLLWTVREEKKLLLMKHRHTRILHHPRRMLFAR